MLGILYSYQQIKQIFKGVFLNSIGLQGYQVTGCFCFISFPKFQCLVNCASHLQLLLVVKHLQGFSGPSRKQTVGACRQTCCYSRLTWAAQPQRGSQTFSSQTNGLVLPHVYSPFFYSTVCIRWHLNSHLMHCRNTRSRGL